MFCPFMITILGILFYYQVIRRCMTQTNEMSTIEGTVSRAGGNTNIGYEP